MEDSIDQLRDIVSSPKKDSTVSAQDTNSLHELAGQAPPQQQPVQPAQPTQQRAQQPPVQPMQQRVAQPMPQNVPQATQPRRAIPRPVPQSTQAAQVQPVAQQPMQPQRQPTPQSQLQQQSQPQPTSPQQAAFQNAYSQPAAQPVAQPSVQPQAAQPQQVATPQQAAAQATPPAGVRQSATTAQPQPSSHQTSTTVGSVQDTPTTATATAPNSQKKATPGDTGKEQNTATSTETFYIDLRPRVIKIPDFKDKTKVNIRYPVIPPFAFVHIYWDEHEKELIYEVEEPLLSETEKEILNLIQLGLEEMINVSFVRASKYNLILKYLERNVQSILVELGTKISKKSYQKLMYYIYRDSVGLNEIEPLLRDYYIEDIECNGTGYPIYIVHRVFENLRTSVIFPDKQKHMDFIEKLAQKCGRYVSYAKPLLDGTLPDGSRINATYTDDITTRGPTFTIRKFTADPWTPAHLIKSGTASADLYAFLWIAIEHKFNMMVIGETASGKTTFMNSVVSFMPPESRICSIEDTRELNLSHINWLPAVTREGFGIPNLMGSKYGEVTLFDLLKESFRQNPDYVIVGEVRGKEAFVLFQGMASGHPSYGTFHAGSVETLMRRLQTPPIELSPALCETLDIVAVCVHIKQGDKGMRRVKEINEIQQAYDNGEADYNQIFAWDPVNDDVMFNGNSEIFRKLSIRSGKNEDELMDELARRSALLQTITDKNILNFKDFNKIIHNFYKDPEAIYKEFNIGE